MVVEPQVDRHHVVNEDKVAHLRARGIATVLTKQFYFAFCLELVVLVKRHAGHATLVLLARTINVEIAKTHHLHGLAGEGTLEFLAAFASHALIEQQLGVAVDIERALECRVFAEGVRTAIGGCAGRVKQARATFLASLVQLDRGGKVVVHHVLAVHFHGVAASTFVENGFDLAVGPFGEGVVKQVGIHIVGNLQVGQVAKLLTLGKVIYGNDVSQAALVETLDKVGANKSGGTGDNDSCHANNSW